MVDAVRILIVEDRLAVGESVAPEFETEPDFEIAGQAGSLAEARAVLTNVDVVILDLGLPGSGAELIPELLATNPSARALVLTASHDPAAAATATEHGAAAVLDKTIHVGRMAQATRRILADGRLQPAPPDPTPVLRTLRNVSSDVGRLMQAVVTNAGTTTTIKLDGEWDLAAREETRQLIATQLARHPARLVLDLSQVTFIDSSALHVLIDLNQYVAWMNVQLLIVPGPKNVQRVFEICGLTDHLPFTDPCDLPREPAVQASRGGT